MALIPATILWGWRESRFSREQRDRLVHVDLERYATSLDKAKERCRQRFREDILYRMKDDIINAKRQFRELNRTMGGLQYGEEVYQSWSRPVLTGATGLLRRDYA